MDAGEQKALRDIEQFGCHVIHVLAEREHPPFAYSVGIQQSSNTPELIVIGLKQPVAHFVINEYNRRIRAGVRFVDGDLADAFLEGFDCFFRIVDRSHYRQYLGWNIWLYRGESFDAMQLLYPDTSGHWPWQREASDWFRSWQPILATVAVQ